MIVTWWFQAFGRSGGGDILITDGGDRIVTDGLDQIVTG